MSQGASRPWLLYIIWSYPQISETYIHKEIAALEDNYHVFVVGRYPADAISQQHVPYRIAQTTEEILVLVHHLRPTVIHTHWLDNVQLVAEIAERSATPFTVRAHSFDVEKINRRNRRMYRSELAGEWKDLINNELCLGVLAFPYKLKYFDDIGVSTDKKHGKLCGSCPHAPGESI